MLFLPSVIEDSGRGLKSFQLQDKLFDENIIILEGGIDDDMCASIKMQLLYLDSKEDCKEINMYISSGGGSVYAGNGVIDVMRHIKTPVNTICTGIAMSMGLAILSSGTGLRKSMPNSRIMAHSVSSGSQGTYADLKVSFEETSYLQEKMINLLADNSKGKSSYEKLKELTQRDLFLSPEESIDLGFIDEIIL